ncbi:MAG: hypothetical protein KDA99_23255, partial [Planctomycetales bacterium]|nr:hypothetical protein [Planctomycetales bacterium]
MTIFRRILQPSRKALFLACCFAVFTGCVLGAGNVTLGQVTVSGGGLTLIQEGPPAEADGFSVPTNLASTGIPFALDELGAPHTIAGVIDQGYGNSLSWISGGDAGTEGPFIGVDLSPSPINIQSFAFGRANVFNSFTDRTLGQYTLQYTTINGPAFDLGLSTTGNANTGWVTIGTIDYGPNPVTLAQDSNTLYQLPSVRHAYNFNPVNATGIRLLVPDVNTAIDEIEVYNSPQSFLQLPPPPPPINIDPAAGYQITWDGNDGDFFDPNAPPAGAAVPDNSALSANGATAFASSDLGPELGINFHVAINLNDGTYGNSNSWIGGDPATNPFGDTAFAGIRFPSLTDVGVVAFGRDNGNMTADACGGQCTDRSMGLYTLQFTRVNSPNEFTLETGSAATGWESIGTIEYTTNQDAVVGDGFTSYLRHQFEVSDNGGNPLQATGIRLVVPATGIGGGTAIDEIEVYAAPLGNANSFTWNVDTSA